MERCLTLRLIPFLKRKVAVKCSKCGNEEASILSKEKYPFPHYRVRCTKCGRRWMQEIPLQLAKR